MMATYRSLSEEEQALLQGLINDTHDQFVETVAIARKKPRDEIDRIADGRILTGRQAHTSGLVDALGDLECAVERAAKLAGLREKPKVLVIQPHKSFWQRLLRPILGGSEFGFIQPLLRNSTSLEYTAPPLPIPMWIMPGF
jgi:protease-4